VHEDRLLLVALAVFVGLLLQQVPRPSVERAHLARELARRGCGGVREPRLGTLRRGYPRERPRLRPRDAARDERALERLELRQGPIRVRELLELAARDPEAFGRVVATARPADPLPAAQRLHAACEVSERPPQRRPRARQRDEASLEVGRVEIVAGSSATRDLRRDAAQPAIEHTRC